MNCDIVFTIGGEEVIFKDTGLKNTSSLSDIAKYLVANKDKAKLLRDQLKVLKQFNSEIITYNNPVANATVATLACKYPYKYWPLQTTPILAVNSYTESDDLFLTVTGIHGPRILENGTIIVNVNKDSDITIVNSYLIRKDKIENPSEEDQKVINKYKQYESYFKDFQNDLKKLKTKKETLEGKEKLSENAKNTLKSLYNINYSLLDVNPDINSILLDFIKNSEPYKKVKFNETSLYDVLKMACIELQYGYINDYFDSWTNMINMRLDLTSDKRAYISIDNLKDILQAKGIKYSSDMSLEDIKELFENTTINFPYKPIELNKNRLYLNHSVNKLENLFDDFQMKVFDVIKPVKIIPDSYSYKGYHVYKYRDQYIVVEGLLTRNSIIKNFLPSLTAAKNAIDKKFIQHHNSHYELHTAHSTEIYSSDQYEPGTIIEVLDLDLNNVELPRELKERGDLTLLQLNNYIKRNYDGPEFDTSEKAMAFINMMIDRKTNDKKVQEEVVKIINNAKVKYYYIVDTKQQNSKFNNKYSLRTEGNKQIRVNLPTYRSIVYEIDRNTELNKEYKPKYDNEGVIINRNILKNLSQFLNDKFGIQIEVLTNDEISSKFPDIKSNAKAFIVNGVTYINQSMATINDVFHEYSHIFLGILKVKNPKLYNELLNSIQDNYKKKQLKELYPNLAEQDLMEECFAELMGEYLAGRDLNKYNKTLSKAKQAIMDETKSIFDKDFDSTDLFNESIWKTMKNITDNLFLIQDSKNGLEISEEVKLNRKASNWIEKQIKDKKIEEDCE